MNIKKHMKQWKAGGIDKQLWSDHAQHATVMIQTGEEGARAVLVDDHGGVRAAFKVPPGQLAEVIGAAAEAWQARNAKGSFAVFSTTETRIRGTVTPPIPPLPPGPGGHERLFMKQTVAAHFAFDAAAELVELADLGQIREVEGERLVER